MPLIPFGMHVHALTCGVHMHVDQFLTPLLFGGVQLPLILMLAGWNI